jgi:hypothetical protein
MDNYKNEPAYSVQVLEFIKAANDFCVYIENINSVEKMQAVNYLSKIAPLLYLKASFLPDVKVIDESLNQRFVTQEQYQEIFNSLRAKMIPDDMYWYVDIEHNEENRAVRGNLAEDFADIYQDLKDFIILYQKNSKAAKQNAVKECSSLFKSRWGIILLQASRVLHDILYKDDFCNNTVENIL